MEPRDITPSSFIFHQGNNKGRERERERGMSKLTEEILFSTIIFLSPCYKSILIFYEPVQLIWSGDTTFPCIGGSIVSCRFKYIFFLTASWRRRLKKKLCCVRHKDSGRTRRSSCSRLSRTAKAAAALSDRLGKENNEQP